MYKKSAIKRTTISLLLLCLMTSTVAAQQPDVVVLMPKDLTDIPGKEALMLTVVYPPGGSSPVHRHNAQAFVYVLEGSIVMRGARYPRGSVPDTLESARPCFY